MKTIALKKAGRGKLFATLLILLFLCIVCVPFFSKRNTLARVSADVGDVMTIQRYDVDMRVQTDRKVVVKETIVMTANKSGSEFTRSLPMEGNRYMDASAFCVGENAEFFVNDDGDYLNIVCKLATPRGVTRTYEIGYTMETPRGEEENGMQIDVVGFGWTVPLHNVTVTMHFPDSATIEKAMIARYGQDEIRKTFDYEHFSDDGKTLTLKAERLDTYYNAEFDERVAEGIYVRFTLADGVLKSFASTQIFPEGSWRIWVIGGVALVLTVLLVVLLGKKREIITTVNITAPDNMDPMKMGKLLDGNVDNEDVTSMIYYFAYKGYLSIDLSDEKNPAFTKLVAALPETAKTHEKTLFDGLFRNGDTVRVSDLKERFYVAVDKAKKQLLTPKMYDRKSVFLFVCGGILALLTAFILPFWLGRTRIGGGYTYLAGAVFIAPIVGIWAIGCIRENYRYKWKKGKQFGLFLVQVLIMAVSIVIFVFGFASHIMTRWEKLYISVIVLLTTFLSTGSLSRTEEYASSLGQIIGFKEFIVVTEEEKIKFMLEENPELYYKVLPYAQVLGVTNEWQNKFKGILLEPPSWCYGNFTVFDYIILNRCLRAGMIMAMSRPQPKGGSFVGKSGGGGHFGGFGGGGFGGGGGSWR